MIIRIDDTFDAETAELQQDEKDRLLLAILHYQMDGSAPDLLGNERFLWPIYRVRIDQQREESRVKAQAGRRSGEMRRNRNEQTTNTIEQHETCVFSAPPEKESTPEPLKEKESEKGNEPPEGPQTAKTEKVQAEKLFDRLWAAYPRKENRKNALRAFLKLRPDENLLDRMLKAIEKQRASPQWLEAGGKFIPQASTWLNGERWEDQPNMTAGQITVSAQQYRQRDYTEEELDAMIGNPILEEARRWIDENEQIGRPMC